MKRIIILIEELLKKIGNWVEKHSKITFAIILAVAILLNIYKLDVVPKGVNVDEAGMAYDGYCIANYGTDRNMYKFPVYFVNFGEGQNALYIYLAAILIKFFGINTLIIRIPALILSIIEVIVSYLLVKKFKGKKMGLLFMLLITISPWHIMKSRWSLESYLLSPMLLFSVYTLLIATKNKKNYMYIISGLLFGITLYSYAISYITVPIFLILMFIYLLRKKEINLKQTIAFTIPLLILAIPLVLMQLVQFNIVSPINSFISMPKLPNSRGRVIEPQNILQNIASLKNVFFDDIWEFNTVKGYGTMYYFGVLLEFIGLVISVKNICNKNHKEKYNTINKKDKSITKDIKSSKIEIINDKNKENKITYKESNINKFEINLDLVMIFYFISNIIWGLLVDCDVNRVNGIYIPLTYFVLVSLRFFYKNIKQLFAFIGIIYIISFISFTIKYFQALSKPNIQLFDNGIVELTEHLKEYEKKDIYIEPIKYSYWIFELYADPLSPEEYTNTFRIADITKTLYNFGKYHNGEFNVNELDNNAIYVTINQEKVKLLEKSNFKVELYNKYYICYKDN